MPPNLKLDGIIQPKALRIWLGGRFGLRIKQSLLLLFYRMFYSLAGDCKILGFPLNTDEALPGLDASDSSCS